MYTRYDLDTVLSIAYQVHSNQRLQIYEKMDKHFSSKGDSQALLLRKDETQITIFRYNTYIWNQLLVTIQNINCTEGMIILIYDGPNSKSKLLGELPRFHAETVALESSLSIVSMYFMFKLFPVRSLCFSFSVDVRQRFVPEILFEAPSTDMTVLKRNYKARNENVLKKFRITVPVHKFINIKINQFEYTGNTEAGCYFGGMVIKSVQGETTGPLCGEVGRRIFEDNRLDGLSLSSNTADIFIFLYSGQHASMLFDMIISSDTCEGLANHHSHYFGRYVTVINTLSSPDPFIAHYLLTAFSMPSHGCVKFQYFIHSILQSTLFVWIEHSNGRRIAYSAELKMVSGTMPCHFISYGEAYQIFLTYDTTNTSYYLPCQAEKKKTVKVTPFFSINITHGGNPCPDPSFNRESFEFFDLKFDLIHALSCAPMNDGVTQVIFHSPREEVCANEEMNHYNISGHDFLSSPYNLLKINKIAEHFKVEMIYTNCLSTEFLLSDGL